MQLLCKENGRARVCIRRDSQYNNRTTWDDYAAKNYETRPLGGTHTPSLFSVVSHCFLFTLDA